MGDIGTPGPPASGAPPQNLWASINQFYSRGGFVNGLNPAVVGRIWYVNGEQEPQTINLGSTGVPSTVVQGSDSNTGRSPSSPFATIARAFAFIDQYDVVVLSGIFREQVVAPTGVFDVTVIGAANRPRQATSGGVATGGGASWLPPTSPTATTPLLELVRQGWNISNIEFTPHTSSAAIRLTRSASVDLIDAGHAQITGCMFGANGGTGQIGIEDNGGCGFTLVQNNRFQGLTTAMKGLNTAAAVPQMWQILRNYFNGNTNAIGMSLTESLVQSNIIRQTANDTNFKVNLIAVAAQGSLNDVIDNIFPDAAANVTIAKGYKPGTTDVWRNYVTDTAAYIVTVPA